MTDYQVSEDFKRKVSQNYTGIIYDWYYMEIAHHCEVNQVTDGISFRNTIKFLIDDSKHEPKFKSFLEYIDKL